MKFYRKLGEQFWFPYEFIEHLKLYHYCFCEVRLGLDDVIVARRHLACIHINQTNCPWHCVHTQKNRGEAFHLSFR